MSAAAGTGMVGVSTVRVDWGELSGGLCRLALLVAGVVRGFSVWRAWGVINIVQWGCSALTLEVLLLQFPAHEFRDDEEYAALR